MSDIDLDDTIPYFLPTNSTPAAEVLIMGQPRRWHPLITDAPRNFDGFGTWTALDSGTKRLVMVEPEHLEWQQKRYLSGLRSAGIPSRAIMQSLPDLLIRRLVGGEA